MAYTPRDKEELTDRLRRERDEESQNPLVSTGGLSIDYSGNTSYGGITIGGTKIGGITIGGINVGGIDLDGKND